MSTRVSKRSLLKQTASAVSVRRDVDILKYTRYVLVLTYLCQRWGWGR